MLLLSELLFTLTSTFAKKSSAWQMLKRQNKTEAEKNKTWKLFLKKRKSVLSKVLLLPSLNL